MTDYSSSSMTSGTPVQGYVSSGQVNSNPYDITSEIIFTPRFDNEQMVVKYISSGIDTTGSLGNIKDEILITGKK